MKATGQMLKERREALKISLAEVSISTKITSRMLQAIEAGDMDHLPARTFLRGFVKSYAAYLKMDTDLVLKSFNEDMAALEPQPPTPAPAATEAPAPAPERHEAAAPTPKAGNLIPEGISNLKKAGLGMGVIGLVAMIVVVYQLVQKYEREGRVETPPPTLSKIEPSKEESPAKEPAEAAEEPAKPAESAAASGAVTVAKPATEEKPVEAVKPAEPPKPVAETPKPPEPKPALETKPPEAPKPVAEAPKPAPVAEVKPPAPAPVAETVKPPEPPKPAETKPAVPTSASQEIIIEALDKVDISFRVNNGQIKKVSLAPDQVHTIKAAGIVAIEMSDGGAVNIIHNGRDVGVPGDLGRPKKIQLP